MEEEEFNNSGLGADFILVPGIDGPVCVLDTRFFVFSISLPLAEGDDGAEPSKDCLSAGECIKIGDDTRGPKSDSCTVLECDRTLGAVSCSPRVGSDDESEVFGESILHEGRNPPACQLLPILESFATVSDSLSFPT